MNIWYYLIDPDNGEIQCLNEFIRIGYRAAHIYPTPDKEKGIGGHYKCDPREGVVCSYGLWLKERNDEKARKIFLDTYKQRLVKVEQQRKGYLRVIKRLEKDNG